MEKLFKALSNHDALWVVMVLAANGSQRQTDLIAALHDAHPDRPARNSGSMSNLVAPLMRAGIVAKEAQSEELRLANPVQLRRLLVLASAISVATGAELHREADEQHARLMRAITHAQNAYSESASS